MKPKLIEAVGVLGRAVDRIHRVRFWALVEAENIPQAWDLLVNLDAGAGSPLRQVGLVASLVPTSIPAELRRFLTSPKWVSAEHPLASLSPRVDQLTRVTLDGSDFDPLRSWFLFRNRLDPPPMASNSEVVGIGST